MVIVIFSALVRTEQWRFVCDDESTVLDHGVLFYVVWYLVYVIVCILLIMVIIVLSCILCTKWITKSLKLKIELLAWGLKHNIY
jgi:hypothetical protein